MNNDFLRFLDSLCSRRGNTSTPTPTPTNLPVPSYKNISTKEIKAFVLLHKEKIIKVGECTIPAPIGVDIDPKTGELTLPIEILPFSDVVLNPNIVKDILINEGFIKIKIIVNNPDPEPCPDVRKSITKEATVPIQSVHQIKGICPDDHVQEKVKIKSIYVIGIPDDSIPKSTGQKINLIIKVILEVKLSIFREEIISVLSCR